VSTPAGTHKYLAMLLGGARGIPPSLAAELADAFDNTWGFWSHDDAELDDDEPVDI